MDLSEYQEIDARKVLIYGPPKSGKTARVGELAQHGFTLYYFDLENGIKTLIRTVKPEFHKNIKVFNIPDHRHYPIAIDTVREVLKGGSKKVCTLHGKNNCPLCAKEPKAKFSELDLRNFTNRDILVIDSLTQLSNSAINKRTLPMISKPGGEDYQFTFHDYRMQGALLDEVLSKIQVAPVNVIVISHETEIETPTGDNKVVPVAGTTNFSKNSAKYFDEVVYCTVINRDHKVFSATTYSNKILTGGRSGIQLENTKERSLVELFDFTRAPEPFVESTEAPTPTGETK